MQNVMFSVAVNGPADTVVSINGDATYAGMSVSDLAEASNDLYVLEATGKQLSFKGSYGTTYTAEFTDAGTGSNYTKTAVAALCEVNDDNGDYFPLYVAS